jgi:alpha-ketoglutarate-dependent taurine dioxygenase
MSMRPFSAGSRAGSRKPVRVSREELVRTSYLDPERRFPLVVEPGLSGLNPVSYAAANRDLLEEQLLRHGAILFRGFDFQSVEAFQQFIASISPGALEYTERSSPRSRVEGKIFTSTDYPPDYPIFLHNEQSYNLTFPRKILFFCVTPAEEGGATPIADCRRVYQRVPEAVRERFERLGYLYVRNFGDGFGLSWQEAFQTDDRAAVERYCAERRIELEWREGGRLKTRQARPAVARHPATGERTWLNHLTFFHVSTLVPAVRDALLRDFREDDLPNNTWYGDGTPIEPEVLDALRDLYREETVSFPWRQGDVLMLDNMLSAHGREPYRGPRKVVVGMADLVHWDDVGI